MLRELRSDLDDKNLAEKGFTLVELLVVIVILGILAAVVVFAVGGITDRGQASSCKAEGRAFQTAVEAANAKQISVDQTDVAAAAVTLTSGGSKFLSSTEFGYVDDSEIAGSYATGWTYAGGVVDTGSCA